MANQNHVSDSASNIPPRPSSKPLYLIGGTVIAAVAFHFGVAAAGRMEQRIDKGIIVADGDCKGLADLMTQSNQRQALMKRLPENCSLTIDPSPRF